MSAIDEMAKRVAKTLEALDAPLGGTIQCVSERDPDGEHGAWVRFWRNFFQWRDEHGGR